MGIIETEKKRLESIKVPLPKIVWNNCMSDRERDYFIIGQKMEFKIITEGLEGEKNMRNNERLYEIRIRKVKILPQDEQEYLADELGCKPNDLVIKKTLFEKVEGDPLSYLQKGIDDAVKCAESHVTKNTVLETKIQEKRNPDEYTRVCPNCKADAFMVARNDKGFYFKCKGCGINTEGIKIYDKEFEEQKGSHNRAYHEICSNLKHFNNSGADYKPLPGFTCFTFKIGEGLHKI